jgi:hypothetical protein
MDYLQIVSGKALREGHELTRGSANDLVPLEAKRES